MGKYKYRHQEKYRGYTIDLVSNSKKELIEKVQKKKEQIDGTIIDGNTKLKNYAEKWLEAYKFPNVATSWYNEICRILNTFVASIGNKPIKDIREIEVQEYLNKCRYYSQNYLNKIYDIINQFFTRMYKDRILPFPFDLQKPKGKTSQHGRSISPYEREILLKVLNGHRGELFCKFMLFCGLRGGEVSALQWKDIDFKKEVVNITKALKRDGYIGVPKSTSGVRTVPIPKTFITELKKHRKNPFEYICTMKNGKPYSMTARRNMWNNVRRLMNIEMGCKVFRNELIPPYPLASDFKLHNLRHTYCTDLEVKGVPINIAKYLMGHSSISVTSQIYTHTGDAAIENVKKLINI